MSENMNGANPEATVDLPSKLRIRQRLGQVSTSRDFKRQVVPKIVRLGRQTLPTDEFLTAVSSELAIYSTATHEGIPEITRAQMPKIIDGIVIDDQQCAQAQQRWAEMVAEQHSVD